MRILIKTCVKLLVKFFEYNLKHLKLWLITLVSRPRSWREVLRSATFILSRVSDIFGLDLKGRTVIRLLEYHIAAHNILEISVAKPEPNLISLQEP